MSSCVCELIRSCFPGFTKVKIPEEVKILRHKNVIVSTRHEAGFRGNDQVRHLEAENQIREI